MEDNGHECLSVLNTCEGTIEMLQGVLWNTEMVSYTMNWTQVSKINILITLDTLNAEC